MAPGLVDRPHGSGDCLVMVFHGQIELGGPQGLEPHPPQTLMVWRTGTPQLYGNRTQGWLHSWIHLRGLAVDQLLAATRLPCDRPIAGIDPALVERANADLHQELGSRLRPDPAIAEALVGILLRSIARCADDAPGAEAVPEALLAVRRHLQTHFDQPIRLGDLGRLAGCSPNHLCGAFRRHFGTTPIDFLIRLRLERARVLLADRNRSIRSAAAAVGYADPHTFTKLCRSRLGCPPSQLRTGGRSGEPTRE